MKKVILLAGLLLMGVSCSKSQGENIGGGVVQQQESAVYPKEKKGDDQNYTTTAYELDSGKVKKVVEETYQAGQKKDIYTRITEVTYTNKKYPTKLSEKQNGNTRQLEYTYDSKDRVKVMNLTQGSNNSKRIFEYDNEGRITKETLTQPGALPTATTYTYTGNTVVEKESTSPNTTKTYTFEKGNLVKEVYEQKDEAGNIAFSETKTYEYDTTIKNPAASIEHRLVSLNYFYNPLFSKENSENVVTKEVSKYSERGREEVRTVTYIYEKNDKGYPTKATEVREGNRTVTVFTY